jgi:hypothetical protein
MKEIFKETYYGMKEIISEVYYGSKDLWKNDRKEFWDIYLGMGLVVFVFWVCIWVLIPIFGD